MRSHLDRGIIAVRVGDRNPLSTSPSTVLNPYASQIVQPWRCAPGYLVDRSGHFYAISPFPLRRNCTMRAIFSALHPKAIFCTEMTRKWEFSGLVRV
jgi:hypothetical protein